MADDENSYLQADFDPGTLTVPRLRSILVAHNVAYPSSAKKPDLVGLFNENIAPQARKIRTAQSNTKRSTRGIVDVPSGQSSQVSDDDEGEADEVQPMQTPATIRRTSRRTTRAQTEEAVAPTPRTSRSTRHSTAPLSELRSPTKRSKVVENVEPVIEEPKKLATKRSRQSLAPATGMEGGSSEQKFREGPDSPFSKENPFQSGSPPPPADRSKSSDRRRTTLGRPVVDETPRRETRRRTDGFAAVKREEGRSSHTFEMPITRLKKQDPDEQDDGLQAGEEFTPEEQLDLVQANGSDGSVALRPKKRRQQSGVAKAAPWSILVALLGGLATVWRQEKLQVGYCGVGQPSTAVAGVEIPEWTAAIQPQCEPCPQHAYCYQDLRTVCEQDFILTPHPLSLGGLVPLPPTCEPDSEKVRRIKQVADFAVENELRERNAQYECGEVKTPEIPEAELKASVSAKRSKRMTDEEFDYLWEGALGEILGREEVLSKADGQDSSRRLLRSSSLARVSLSCSIRRSLRATLKQYLPQLIGLVLLSLSAVYGRNQLVVRRSTSTRAKELAGVTLDKLATQASLHATDPASFPEPYVSMVALRDDVLREEFSARERTRLWDVVKGLVEGNANVRTMVREGRTGEVSRVWEWIGAVQMLESPEASGRRSSKRFSLGGAGRIAGSKDRLVEDDTATPDKGEVRKWREGPQNYF